MAALDRCIFRKTLGYLSSAVPKILAFGSCFSSNFLSILDCFIPNSQLKYEDSEHINTDCVNTFGFNLHQINSRAQADKDN